MQDTQEGLSGAVNLRYFVQNVVILLDFGPYRT